MKRVIKKPDSVILSEGLKYKKGDSENNKTIRTILEEEQDFFCAYTEYRISAGFARDIEHFDNTIKYKDDYQNWFAVSHRWNVSFKKDEKWRSFEGKILYPTAQDLEDRLWYDEDTGRYLHKIDDIEAQNLVEYLQINHIELIEERINHPDTKKQLIQFRRAMETVFEIKF
jgi:hypothetical protein